jgi:hypothetical protein
MFVYMIFFCVCEKNIEKKDFLFFCVIKENHDFYIYGNLNNHGTNNAEKTSHVIFILRNHKKGTKKII